jgi:hypothetical protein
VPVWTPETSESKIEIKKILIISLSPEKTANYVDGLA